ncbi:hypothetical protein GWK36_13125 [Caldichromatium japonicum]|uniref:Uncharacterized protein n=1 Tax=Caldichromatium japonicum TaxID=2699430 RepID=A0A6G7VFZ7_9GAMM|nr:hypothetical protein [Caldichromatium japonicum]QIK38768.1 hypothetical protein GWK36_13125 [Caldichromatium japonicum]
MGALELYDRHTGQWRPLRRQEQVRVVTNSFLVRGGDGYAIFKCATDKGRVFETGINSAQALIDLLQQGGGRATPESAGDQGPPTIGALAYADYSTQQLIDPQGRPLGPDPEAPPRCRP